VSLSPRAQSEVTGELFLAAVVIIGAASLGVLTFGFTEETTEPGPAADVNVAVESGQLTFVHGGGTAIPPEELRVQVQARSGATTRQSFEGAGSNPFAAGGELSLKSPYASTEMAVTLVHQPSGTVLLEDIVTVQATKAELAGPIGKLGFSNQPATDQDGDGDFEDVDGDGDTDVFDFYYLYFAYLDIERNGAYNAGSDAADLYDFNNDGAFDRQDVIIHLYTEVFSLPFAP
jgi:FlaG/FlaF family flagellin (archaellin)